MKVWRVTHWQILRSRLLLKLVPYYAAHTQGQEVRREGRIGGTLLYRRVG